jgi:osmotically-inducible protein OsmY
MIRKNTLLRKSLAAFAVAVALSGCAAFSGRETPGEYVDDASFTTKVKAQIFNDPMLKSQQISVETMQDTVQLSGFVDSAQVKDRAGAVARGVEGVHSVKNNLVVR